MRLNLGVPTAWFVSFTILVASLVALSKDNLKARLAYSTVSQLSYIILGVALLTPAGIEGGIIHIVNHAFAKITLFFCAGAIYVATHKKDISEMKGLGRAMPLTFGAFAVASLSMIGVPPVGRLRFQMVSPGRRLGCKPGGDRGGAAGEHRTQRQPTLPRSCTRPFSVVQPDGESAHRQSERRSPAMLIPLLFTAFLSVAVGYLSGVFHAAHQGVFA